MDLDRITNFLGKITVGDSDAAGILSGMKSKLNQERETAQMSIRSMTSIIILIIIAIYLKRDHAQF